MAGAILFDLDRTLVDAQTYTDYDAAAAEVRELIGEWPDLDVPATEWDAPTRECMAILVALSGDDRWTDVSAAIERHELATVRRSSAMPGLAHALAATAQLPRAVITLLPQTAARAVLDRHGVNIDLLVARQAVFRPKPSPDQLLHALVVLGVPAGDAVFIGDSSWDAEAARAAGIRFLGVTNHGVSLFDDEVDTHPDLHAAIAVALAP
ncbi:MAG: HAD family hydrolase [Acidimicrobiales bacterium]